MISFLSSILVSSLLDDYIFHTEKKDFIGKLRLVQMSRYSNFFFFN